MAKPKYVKSNKHFFVNPYNFVPVDFKYSERADVTKNEAPLLTGYISCSLKCRTPLAIPDTANRWEEDVAVEGKIETHYHYPFVGTADGIPRIPGSTIRGTIRNVYETITNSCFGTMRENTIITSRIKDSFRPGVLIRENNKWSLYGAKRYIIVTDKKFYDNQKLGNKNITLYKERQLIDNWGNSGTKVTFDLAYDSYKKAENYSKGKYIIGTYVKEIKEGGAKEGYLCIGERAPNRHFQSIFSDLSRECVKENLDLSSLEEILAVYRNEKTNKEFKKTHKGYKDYEEAKANGVIPVYYNVLDGALYMSFAAIGRKAFQRTLNEIAGEKDHKKCSERNCLCPACALFGTVEGEGLGSSVRFADAEHINFDENRFEEKTFGELGSPRISYSPFYLIEESGKEKHTNGYDNPALKLRGRKFYWHHVPSDKSVAKNNRNGSFEVLSPEKCGEGPHFTFKVFFDGITKEQLKLLSVSIHLYDNDINGKMCHKLGHGKPLGYGSVKMTIDRCVVRSFDLENGWKETEMPVENLCDDTCYKCGYNTMEALKAICDFDAIKETNDLKVEYPNIYAPHIQNIVGESTKLKKNDIANHKWFTSNYSLGKDYPEQPLPQIIDENKKFNYEPLKLAKYEIRLDDTAIFPEKVYRGIITSVGRTEKNPHYLIYDIRILDDKKYEGKDCTASELKRNVLSIGQEVEVVLFKGTRFNIRRSQKKGR